MWKLESDIIPLVQISLVKTHNENIHIDAVPPYNHGNFGQFKVYGLIFFDIRSALTMLNQHHQMTERA